MQCTVVSCSVFMCLHVYQNSVHSMCVYMYTCAICVCVCPGYRAVEALAGCNPKLHPLCWFIPNPAGGFKCLNKSIPQNRMMIINDQCHPTYFWENLLTFFERVVLAVSRGRWQETRLRLFADYFCSRTLWLSDSKSSASQNPSIGFGQIIQY